MRVLIAFDKFKDALTAADACRVAAETLATLHPEWELDCAPFADGGDGFAQLLTSRADGRWEPCVVSGPRGSKITAAVGFVSAAALGAAARDLLGLPPLADEAELAVLDLASASGLALLAPERRDPWHTTTRGTGELLAFAARRGAAAIVLGLGGSATNDLALGALVALGWRAENAAGELVAAPVPARWTEIARLVPPPGGGDLPPLRLACDVANPLLGPQGATATFGPQKGLEPETAAALEQAVERVARLLAEGRGADFAKASAAAGAGAAGGAGFGLVVGAGAEIVSGAALVEAWLDLPARIARADLVLTGEGRFDATSLGGKGPGAVIAESARAGKRVAILAGAVDAAARAALPENAAAHAITPTDWPRDRALAGTRANLAATLRTWFA